MLKYKKNIFSQNGEDGVLEFIFKQLNIDKGTFFEFGACDGIHFSNSRKLVLEGWSGLLVECDIKYKNNLENNCKNYNVVYEIGYVEKEGYMSIDSLWDRASTKLKIKDLDFLSIDIDGNDDELLESLIIKPKVIMIEVNAGHHPDYNIRIPSEIAKSNIGQSIKIMCELAPDYTPITYTGNLILIRNDCINDNLSKYIKTNEELYTEFWKELNINGKKHLFNTFVKTNGYYNGFKFDTSFMIKLLKN